jgi:Ion channel
MVPSSSQEVAVLLPLMISLATTLTTIVVHGVALAAIVRFVLYEHRLGHTGAHFWRDVGIVACATLLALAAHLLEITVWAGALESCGEFTRFAAAFYHSAMNYTSLGYGDVVMSASWKLLGPLETANGMLMFGVSTGMIFTVVQRLFQTKYGEPIVASTPLPPVALAAA